MLLSMSVLCCLIMLYQNTLLLFFIFLFSIPEIDQSSSVHSSHTIRCYIALQYHTQRECLPLPNIMYYLGTIPKSYISEVRLVGSYGVGGWRVDIVIPHLYQLCVNSLQCCLMQLKQFLLDTR